jgi:uroporphyrinogen decarboxylase
MIEGEGGTDFSTSRQVAWHDPALFEALLARIVSATTAYLLAQIDAGAEALQIFDSWAGAVPASLFETAVIRPTAAIVSAVKAQHPGIPVIGFPRGAGAWVGLYAERTGVDAVGVDQMTDLTSARAAARRPLQGNLDPVLLREGGTPMRTAIASILEAMHGNPFIFNLGHGVFPDTPPDHVFELVQAVRASVR